jgi:hypothetical protein
MQISNKRTESVGASRGRSREASGEVRQLRAVDRSEPYRSAVALTARFLGRSRSWPWCCSSAAVRVPLLHDSNDRDVVVHNSVHTCGQKT